MCIQSGERVEEFFLSDLKVEASDITSLHNAFAHADPDFLLDAVLMADPAFRCSPAAICGSARDRLLRRVGATLELMYSMEPIVEESRTQLIVPWQDYRCAEEDQQIVRGVGSCILEFGSLPEARAELERYGGRLLTMPAFAALVDEGDHPLDALEQSGLLEPIQIISLESWPEALGRCIWLPSTLCELERYAVLASVFWSMTYGGFACCTQSSGVREGHRAPSCSSTSLWAEYAEKMELFAEALSYNAWVETVRAGEALCACAPMRPSPRRARARSSAASQPADGSGRA